MLSLASLKFVEDIAVNPVHTIRLYTDPKSGKRVIAKMLTSSSPTELAREMLKGEYEITVSLTGDNHVKPLRLEYQGLNPVILYEDFSGVSIEDVLRQGSLSIKVFFSIAISLASALENIHSQNVAHQDIKPGNILVHQRNAEYRFADFSLAKKWSRQEEKWVAGGQGSIKYISPEQTGRIDCYIDYRTDFYSLGITFYRMLCGTLPFDSDEPGEVIHGHIAKEPPPPHSIKSNIPEQVSNIILKMIAKSPKDRYQSAIGIKEDLALCYSYWQKDQDIPSFPLGEKDVGGILEISSNFYGREQEYSRFKKITEEMGRQTPLMITIGGQPGSGKSSFIMELARRIDLGRGFFIRGKYDQYQRHRPLTAIITAFSQLFEKLYERDGEKFQTWIRETLGDNLPAITQLVPSLELLMGKQGEAVEVSPADAQNRFAYNLGKIIELTSSEDDPIFVFLDNLQWIDAASLNLLATLLTNTKCPGLIIIGAFRSSEVTESHPLSLTLNKVRNENSLIKEISMGPLELEATTQFLADTLKRSDEKLKSLASKFYVKTGGNPLLTAQLISTLYEDEMINFNHSTHRWDWREEDIAKVQVDIQVVDLILNKIETLPEKTQELLFLAASFGDEISLNVLASVMEMEEEEVLRHAERGLGVGVIDLTKQDSGYRLIFSHDRFREACYEIVSQEDIAEKHKNLAISLIHYWDTNLIQENILPITNLLNHAASELSEGESEILAEFNLIASKKAIESFAFQQGLVSAELGISLLSEDAWTENYELMFALHKNAIIASGELKQREKLMTYFNALVGNCKDILETTASHVKVINYIHSLGDLEKSIQIGKDFLKKLRFIVPDKGSKFLVLKEYLFARLAFWWKTGKNKKRPDLVDPRIRAIIDIQEALLPPMFFIDMPLWVAIILQQYSLMLKHGKHENEVCYRIPFFYLGRGVFKDFSLSRSIIDDEDINSYKSYPFFPQLSTTYCGGIRNYMHIPKVIEVTEEMYLYDLSMGDHVHSTLLYMLILNHQFAAGFPISKCKKFITEHESLNRQADISNIELISQSLLALYDSLKHGDEYTVTLKGHQRKPESLFQEFKKKEMHSQLFHVSYLLLFLSLINKQGEDAWEYCNLGRPYRANTLGTPYKEHFFLYETLAIGLCYENKTPEEQKGLRKICKSNIAELKIFMRQQEENYAYKYWLASGEYARIKEHYDRAHHHYRKGILSAIENGFIHDAAIGLEKCGAMMLSLDDQLIGKTYLKQALEFYEIWGAQAKVSAMKEEWGDTLTQSQISTFDLTKDIDTSASTSRMSEIIDTKAYVSAAEAISKEIDLESLIEVLVDVSMKNAGAQHVVLLTKKKNKWFLTAEKRSGEKEVNFLYLPLNQASDRVPITVIGEVIQQKQEIVVRNANKLSEFTQDPYIIQHNILSILCIPLLYQNKLVATLYLENSLTEGAFTEERVKNILLLSSHIANSIENALLYEELKDYSKELELKVDERTKEITEKNVKLIETNDALSNTLEQLNKTQDQLIASEKLASLGEVTAGIAHEIRNPLNFINNFSAVNIEMFEENNQIIESLTKETQNAKQENASPEIIERQDAIKQFLEDIELIKENEEKINRYGKRSEKIISLMEKHAKVGKGILQATNLAEFIEQSLATATLDLKEKHPDFLPSIEKQYDKKVKQVPMVQDEMDFVFYNVIKNALEALIEKAEKDSEHNSKLSIETKQVDDTVEIKIRDNGTGIKKENLENVFTPFYTTKPTGEAIGLALSISHSIVSSIHHGTMNINSQPNSHTEVIITLPLTPPSDESSSI